LKIPFAQRKLLSFSESKLSNLLGAPVIIGKIDVKWLSRATFKDVYIEDQKGDTLFKADNITAGFKLLPILKNKWVLKTVRLFGLTGHIKKESSASETNFQFIINALSRNNGQGDSNFELKIESILIRRGKITYDVLDKEYSKQFNPNHLNIENLSGKLSVKHYSKDSLHAVIGKLSFTEKSGLIVKRISAGICGNRDSLSVDNLILSLPNSSVFVPSVAVFFAQNDSLPLLSNHSSIVFRLASSTIAPRDFSFLTPHLKDFPDMVEVSADISGIINSISLNKLTLTYSKDLSLTGSLDLKNFLNSEEELYLFGQISRLHVTAQGLSKIAGILNQSNVQLPTPVLNLEQMNFTGEISGFTDRLVAFGSLTTPIGSIQMDMLISRQRDQDTTLHLKGLLASSDLPLQALFEEGSPFGKTRFNVELDFVQPRNKSFSGTINAHIHELEYLTYNYENIYLLGKFSENEYEGLIRLNDPNGQFEMQGLFRNEDKKSVFDFMAQLTHFQPAKLHLTDRFDNPDISLGITANFSGNNPDDFNGYIELKDFTFITEKDSFAINNLRIEASADEQALNRIDITSSLINGYIKGLYSFATLIPNLMTTFGNYLPSYITAIHKKKPSIAKNNFEFNFVLTNTENVSKTLNLPVAILQKAHINGHYNCITHSVSVSVDVPSVKTGNLRFEDVKLRLDNPREALEMTFDAIQIGKHDIRHYLHLASNIKDDYVHSRLQWESDTDEKYKADISSSALFVEETAGKIRTEITIPPAEVVLKDSVWHIEPASITIIDGRAMIDNFYFTKENQHLLINGVVSNNLKDTVLVDLKDIEISYIFDILNNPQVQFGGHATGTVKACDLFGSLMIEGRLEVDDFSYHEVVQGNLKLTSEWDNDRQGILLVGSIYKNENTYTDIEGYIFPVGPEQGLALNFNANEINVAFLHKYMNSFADSISGLGFGKVYLHGSFSDIFLEGTPYVRDAKIKLNILNTTYTFSDTVYLEANQIFTRNTTVFDREGHSGSLDFSLNHNCFRDLSYNLDVKTNNVLVYDITERLNPEIYGKVYASGTARIYGTEENVIVEGNVRSDPGTFVGFNFSNNSTVDSYDFITFIAPSETEIPDEKNGNVIPENNRSSMDYTLNFLVNVTPVAQFELMMNPSTGDKITGYGNGNFQIQYGNLTDIQIFGNYLITGGTYTFNLEQVIRKRFNIRDGSLIAFRGDPMVAELNINAIYNLAANIQDLEEQLIRDSASPTVMVNCVLRLDGHLQNPAITFDLELPNSNAELERRVKSFIDTEDMMTRQIIYLLLLHKFYTPDYSRNDFRANEFSAVASQALSAQLSNILNRLTDKVQFGALIRSRQDGIKDTEVDMLLSSQLLNNRLLFNGNFGYKDNSIQSNAFVGEFDLEYKLSRSGEINLKAYNHANDFYRYTKSLTRQGVGVMFRKDFSALTDLFRRREKTTQGNNDKTVEL